MLEWVVVCLYILTLVFISGNILLTQIEKEFQFQLKTTEQDNYEIDLRYMRGSFIVSINEISTRTKRVMKNGAMSVYIISVSSDDQYSLQRLTCLEGFHKERLHVVLKDNKLKVMFAPIPRDDINLSRFYWIKFNEI